VGFDVEKFFFSFSFLLLGLGWDGWNGMAWMRHDNVCMIYTKHEDEDPSSTSTFAPLAVITPCCTRASAVIEEAPRSVRPSVSPDEFHAAIITLHLKQEITPCILYPSTAQRAQETEGSTHPVHRSIDPSIIPPKKEKKEKKKPPIP
jgi:hypothetical protein